MALWHVKGQLHLPRCTRFLIACGERLVRMVAFDPFLTLSALKKAAVFYAQ